MTFNNIRAIEWPNETDIITGNVTNATLHYIQNIFYNTGWAVTLIYMGLKLMVLPCLERQYSQRNQISASTLLKLRKLASQLQNCLKSTPVAAIGYNERNNTIERCTQTMDEDRLEPLHTSWSAINKRLTDSTIYLRQFVNCNSNETRNINEFNTEARLLSDQFKLRSRMELQSEPCKKMVTSVREVKGWFVSGRIH